MRRSLKLILLMVCAPAFVRRRELEHLFGRTAAAFGRPVPPAHGRSVRARLGQFALASRDWAQEAMAGREDLAAIGGRLYEAARDLGRGYRARLGILNLSQAFAAARAIYRGLGIDFRGDPRTGRITVRHCGFAGCYTPRVCGLMSALDRGLMAGLAGEGELVFTRRITEGCSQCSADWRPAGPPARRAIVVGSGAGGAAVARELQGAFQVTILEAGREFRPLGLPIRWMERLRGLRLLLDARIISLVFPAMRVRKATGGMLLVNGRGTGGTTTLSAGNALRSDGCLRELGVHLDDELETLRREVPQSTQHQESWTPTTRRLFAICDRLGLAPEATPKLIDFNRCRGCGRCVLGCPHGAKWDSRAFLAQALHAGAQLVSRCSAQRVVLRDGKAVGVAARVRGRKVFLPADLVVLAAGGLGTPVILERSGVRCEPRLFVDPVLCVAAPWPRSRQHHEIPMPFVVQRPGYMISPYFDYVSFLFNPAWRRPADGLLTLMIKLADTESGSVAAYGANRVHKTLSDADRGKLGEAVGLCTRIFESMGVDPRSLVLGTLNAGHPGGTVPLTPADARTLHPDRLPPNVYVADASLLPASLGNPPILTILALAMRIGRICARLGAADAVSEGCARAG